MISRLMKVFLAVASASACLYGMSVFGLSPWPGAVLAAALLLFVAAFTPRLDLLSRVVGNALGVLSLLALLLLLLAGTIGGSFHLSPSNEVIAFLLFLMALFGMTSFFWPTGRREAASDSSTERSPES